MNQVKFKTNIKCSACVEKVNAAFEGKELITNFEVDFKDPQRTAIFILAPNAKVENVQAVINSAGYRAELV